MKAKFGLLGEILGYSLSPAMHQCIFDAHKLDASYELIEIPSESFVRSDVIQILRQYRGVNVTIPYKERIIPFLDEIDPFAAKIGAVNTVLNKDGKLIGYNTDYEGFIETLKGIEHRLSHKKKAVILGTGGAAKMALKALEDFGFEQVVFISRNPKAASQKFETYACFDDSVAPIEADLMVNCTPIGHTIDASWFSKIGFFYDLNYSPPVTALIELAEGQGVHAINGMRMLAVQAIKAEEIWWQRDFDVNTLANQVINLIKSR